MQKKVFAVLIVVSLVIVGGVLSLQPTATEADQKEQFSVSEMIPFGGGADLVGASRLLRSKKELSMTISTTGLTPGNAYTIWWIIFNKPEKCSGDCGMDDFGTADVSVINATGLIVGDDGLGNFSASLREGSAPVGVSVAFGPGKLKDAQKAEVHLAVRDHGVAVAGMVGAQISDVFGGCAAGPGDDCTNVQASIHLP